MFSTLTLGQSIFIGVSEFPGVNAVIKEIDAIDARYAGPIGEQERRYEGYIDRVWRSFHEAYSLCYTATARARAIADREAALVTEERLHDSQIRPLQERRAREIIAALESFRDAGAHDLIVMYVIAEGIRRMNALLTTN